MAQQIIASIDGMDFTVDVVQLALKKAGFDPKGIDGVRGRSTIKAIIDFQHAKNLDIKFPGTVGEKTLKALGLLDPEAKVKSEILLPPWFLEARRKLGLNEKLNNKTLREYLKSDGKTLGDPAKNPWCGDFMETVIALSLPKEPMVTNPYYALNWMKFGVAVPKGIVPLGGIVPFKRPGGGHIGQIAGHDKSYFHVIGGNQSNGVTMCKILKSRLSGPIRWPRTWPLPRVSLPFTTFNGTITTNEA